MSNIIKGQTCISIIPASTTGDTRTDWTVKITKDGTLRPDIAWDVKEITPYYYRFEFTPTDETQRAIWQILIVNAAATHLVYTESWVVDRNTLELNVKQIRSQQ